MKQLTDSMTVAKRRECHYGGYHATEPGYWEKGKIVNYSQLLPLNKFNQLPKINYGILPNYVHQTSTKTMADCKYLGRSSTETLVLNNITEIDMFFNSLWSHIHNGTIEDSLDYVLNQLDERIHNKMYSHLNSIIPEFAEYNFPQELLFAVLSVTLPAKKLLPARDILFAKFFNKLAKDIGSNLAEAALRDLR